MPTLQDIYSKKLSVPERYVVKDAGLVRQIQSRLAAIGLAPGAADGIWGKRTEEAVNQFCRANYLDNPRTNVYGPTFAEKLIESKQLLLGVLPAFKGGDKWATVEAICKECDRQGLPLDTQKAYVLATVEHECDNTWKPIEEYGGKNTRYAPWYGRGFTQLTWLDNYIKYEDITGVPLTKDPNLALRPDVSLFILVHGCKYGTFTGKSIPDYISPARTEFYDARRVINGLDRAEHIAAIADSWFDWLEQNT